MCGGTKSNSTDAENTGGLSPRVRGNPHQAIAVRHLARSIPACAGEPHAQASLANSVTVYPRVCGGTALMRALFASHTGLSPRVRGNPARRVSLTGCLGSIPACAGEPVPSVSFVPSMRVYPRVCGGTGLYIDGQKVGGGLSPRVRGNLRGRRDGPGRRGSIPACAGEPSSSSSPTPPHRVYPRVCGGTARPRRSKMPSTGLSPLTG